MSNWSKLINALFGSHEGPFNLLMDGNLFEIGSECEHESISQFLTDHRGDIRISPQSDGRGYFAFQVLPETLPEELNWDLTPTAVLYRNYTVVLYWALDDCVDLDPANGDFTSDALLGVNALGFAPLADFGGWELISCDPNIRHPFERIQAYATGCGHTFQDAHVVTPFDPEAYGQSFTIAEGKRSDAKNWLPTIQPLGTFLTELCQHRVGTKDGLSFVLADMVMGQRLKTSVKALTGVGLDIDAGTPSEIIDRALAELDCVAVRYTTHSHGKTETIIKNDRVIAFANGREITTDLIRQFLREEEEWDEVMIQSSTYAGTTHTSRGIMAVVQHAPFPKHRVVIPFAAPFVISKEAPTQAEAMKKWAKVPTALAKKLGVPLDKSCTDPSRLFFRPRHDADRPFEISVFGGPCFDWHTLELDDPLEKLEQVFSKNKGKSVTPEGQALGRWCRERGHGFQIADVIQDHCPDRIRGTASRGYNIECPFDDDHTNAGDPEDKACFVVNAGDGVSEIFTISCRHETCQDKTMLDMLGKMLRDSWFDDTVLTDEQHNAIVLESESTAPSTPEVEEDQFVFEEKEDLVAAINRHYCIVKIGSNTRFIDESDDELKFLTKQAMSDWLAPYKLVVEGKDGGVKLVSGFSTWMSSPERRRYSQVVFNPNRQVPANHYNLWKGFAIEPRKGDWSLMQAHFFDIICNGDLEHYIWLMSWLAQMVQQPWNKPGTAVVLRSTAKGTGKSTVAVWLADIFGRHAVTLASARHFLGNFNAHYERAVLAVSEESFWAGDKEAEGVLKHLITGRSHRIERKGVDSIEVDNFTRVMMLTNNKWAVPTGLDERRFLVLDVNESMKQKSTYFEPLYEEAKNGGTAAMLHDLLRFDFGEVDLRNPPKTSALVNQLLESFDREWRWWCDCLTEGEIAAPDGSAEAEWPTDGPLVVSREAVFRSYAAQVKLADGKPPSAARMGGFLKSMLPGRDIDGGRPSGSERRQRQYRLPPLAEARAAFTSRTGVGFDAKSVQSEGLLSEWHRTVRTLERIVAMTLFETDEGNADFGG